MLTGGAESGGDGGDIGWSRPGCRGEGAVLPEHEKKN